MIHLGIYIDTFKCTLIGLLGKLVETTIYYFNYVYTGWSSCSHVELRLSFFVAGLFCLCELPLLLLLLC